MSAESLLKQYSEERAALVERALPKAAAIILGRRRILSGIRWRGDLIVTAAEAIGGIEHVDVRLDGDELGAEVIATDLTTDVAILRVGTVSEDPANGGANDPIANRGSTDASPGASGGLGRRETGASAAATSADPASASPTPLTAPSTGAPGGLSRRETGSSAAATSADLTRPSFALAALRVGEPIVVIGRTSRGPAAIWGSVQLAGPAWSSRRGGRIDQRIELDVAFDSSFEGGAVIDMEGNIVAMAVPGPYHRVLGIPATTIEAVVSKVDKFGRLPKPYIGDRLG